MANILIADDERSILILLEELLKKDRHQVDVAVSGTQACEKIEQNHYELVVTDLHMDKKSGIDVLKAAKQKNPLTEVLILTGYGSITSAVEAMQLGAFEYLTKPIDLQEFRMKVGQALERRNLRMEIERQKRELMAHQEMIQRDLKLAEQVQRSLVPPSIDEEQFQIAVRYSPMIGVGGDFSDIYYDDNEIYLTIVDVTGHGITAALLVNRICMEIRRLVREQLEPASVLYHLNDFITDSFKGTGMFLTMFCSVINLKTGAFRYSGSAHPATLLWRRNTNQIELLESQNPIIGFQKTSQKHFRQDATVIRPGDKLILYTDGIIEVENKDKQPLGIAGLKNLFQPVIFLNAQEVADMVMNGVKKFAHGAQRDDIYLIVLAMN